MTSGTGTHVQGHSRHESLRRFVSLLTVSSFAFAAVHLAAYIAFDSVPNAITAIAMLAYGALLAASVLILRRAALRAAIVVITGGVLVLAFVSPVLVPEAAAGSLIAPILVVAIAMPYIDRERLAGLAAVCWVATVFVALVIELSPATTPTPTWFRSGVMVAQVATIVALLLFLLVEWSRRLRGGAEQMAETNTALKEAQDTVRRINRELRRRVSELEQRNREATLVSQMAGLLQVSETSDEAYAVVGRAGRMLFPGTIGALLVVPESRLVVEVATSWGDPALERKLFEPQDCWALRGGRVHRMEDPTGDPACPHVTDPSRGEYMCIPLTALGTTMGVLHIQALPGGTAIDDHDEAATGSPAPAVARLDDDVRDLGLRVAEHLALAIANFRLRETLQVQSTRDALTGLFNRRYMEESLERELHRAAREEQPLALMLLDLDNFKRFNDRLGHAAGDNLLRTLGEFLLGQVRREDVPCRYGGEEFVVILPKASKDDAFRRAERLREDARAQWLAYGPGVTLSIGIAAYPEDGATARTLLDAADAALYRAKAEGRDRVVVAGAA